MDSSTAVSLDVITGTHPMALMSPATASHHAHYTLHFEQIHAHWMSNAAVSDSADTMYDRDLRSSKNRQHKMRDARLWVWNAKLGSHHQEAISVALSLILPIPAIPLLASVSNAPLIKDSFDGLCNVSYVTVVQASHTHPTIPGHVNMVLLTQSIHLLRR